MGTRLLLITLSIGALVGAVACGDDAERWPTAPSASRPATPVALAISGPLSISQPGETTRLDATLRLSDDTTRDVTTEAQWRALTPDVLTISSPGVVTAIRYGRGNITATYGSGAAATVEVRVAPEGAFLLFGTVTSGIGVRLAQTNVMVTSAAGTMSAATDAAGWYILPALGHTTVRIDRDGFSSFAQEVIVNSDIKLDLQIRRVDAGGSSGTYTLTFTASGSCRLPPPAVQRTYQALVEELAESIVVGMRGADFVVWGGDVGFTGRRRGDTVEFVIRDTYDDGYNLVERIPAVGDLHYSGTATGTITAGNIVTTFRGTLRIAPALMPEYSSTCTADDHTMRFAAGQSALR